VSGIVGLESLGDLRACLGQRELFPDLAPRAYLNHAGISPSSVAVKRAVLEVVEDVGKKGMGAFLRWHTQRQRLKGKLGELIGARAEDIALVPNTTHGVIDIALCFPWRSGAGDRVIVFEGEFPANVTPWQRAAETFGLEVVILPLSDYLEDLEKGLGRLEAELGRGARLVAVSAVEFQTGFRMPLEAMAERCHAHGAELFVDAVQACGAVPIDVRAEGIDYLSSGSHKWMMGLEGAGFLYVNPERVAALRPTVAGWLSHEEGLRFLFEGSGHLRYDRSFKKSAELFEGGVSNAVGFAAMEAALDLIQQIGVPEIFAHVNRYHDRLEAGLIERGFTSLRARDLRARSCTLGVLPPEGVSVVELSGELNARGVACALPDGLLRFAPHWPNSLDEIPFVLGAVDESLSR